MVRRRDTQLSFAQLLLFSATLPQPEALMDPVLRRIDLLLEDEGLVDEVMAVLRRRHAQSSRRGRYGTPAEVVLRMLVLKHVRQWSYEGLCREVAGSRAFHSTQGEQRLEELGVRHRVIPKPGYRSPARLEHERQRWFRPGRAWRAGGEARIGHLKHSFGMERSVYRGPRGMERTILWAAMANNLVAISRAS